MAKVVDEKKDNSSRKRRLLLFPIPFQGHVSPMLHLASLLYSKGFSITLIQTHFNSIDPSKFLHFTFDFIDDGFASLSSSIDPTQIIRFLTSSCSEPFRICLTRIMTRPDPEDDPITCLIFDPMWGFAESVADCFDLPKIALRTGSLSAFVVYDLLPLLREKGYLSLPESKLDEPVPELPPLRVKDLPSESFHEIVSVLVEKTRTSQALICNTYEELESAAISKLEQSLHIPIFPIGPLHRLLPSPSSGSILSHDRTSISWLNTRAPKSVLYVSFGSAVKISQSEFLEIAWGLANSNQPFLWVVRPDFVEGSETSDPASIEGFSERVTGTGHIVKWAPQEEVLAHPSVGGFWTHCGWNSSLETICAGVPVICLPFFADQVITARYMSDSWGVGLRLERGTKREEIERAIRRLMVEKKGEEMRSRMMRLKEKAALCLMEGGSSYTSLERLTNFLLSL